MDKCNDCGGIFYGDGKCRDCGGTGKDQGWLAGMSNAASDIAERLLPGPGEIPDEECSTCDGSGECQTCDGSGETD